MFWRTFGHNQKSNDQARQREILAELLQAMSQRST
jgi:hypothetical protein